jgi:hypothetical protein
MIILLILIAWWIISLIPPFIIKKRLKNLKGLAIAPFIFVTNKQMGRLEWLYLIRHEKEHIRQQRRYSPILFLILYCTEYLINRAKGMDHFQAYWNISFEKKAREAERIGG